MHLLIPILSIAFASVVTQVTATDHDVNGLVGAVHLPIQRQSGAQRVRKRGGASTAVVGVGDNMDVTYNVLVQVGGTLTPLILDTGSSDLWLVSDGCRERCPATRVPLYAQAALKPIGQDVSLLYGDSRTGTHASGPIGMDTVSIAGLSVPDQYFAAIIDTNTTVLDTGSAGILGLGFPPISVIWRQLIASRLDRTMPSSPGRIPSIDSRSDLDSREERRDATNILDSIIDTFSTLGPLLTRLVTLKVLERPLVVTTLQRDTISFSGNDGTLSLGALPYGMTDEQLSWAPVRSYSVMEGGIPPPSSAPNEASVYPLLWEIPLDDIYFDGTKLPRSGLSSPDISLSALIDTGNSLIRGPQDVLSYIYAHLSLDAFGTFDCSTPHNLTFMIGGKPFPIDPRDFAHPAAINPGTVYPDKVARCTPALAQTDPPGQGGFMYSWSLGDPFLKSTMVAFYYGNMTHPSQDPARVGFMSMVPSNAGYALEKAVDAAIANGGVFLSTSEPAPYATAARLVSTMTMAESMPGMTQGSPGAISNAARATLGATPAAWIVTLIAAFFAGMLDFTA